MAHYALINSDNLVVAVITGVDETVTQTDLDGSMVGGSAEAWEIFYASQPQHGQNLYCKRTSYNNNIRKRYAGVGFTYDTARDAFIEPKPWASWVLREATLTGSAPVPYPSTGGPWMWDEATLSWVEW